MPFTQGFTSDEWSVVPRRPRRARLVRAAWPEEPGGEGLGMGVEWGCGLRPTPCQDCHLSGGGWTHPTAVSPRWRGTRLRTPLLHHATQKLNHIETYNILSYTSGDPIPTSRHNLERLAPRSYPCLAPRLRAQEIT